MSEVISEFKKEKYDFTVSLSESQQEKYDEFLSEIKAHLSLSRKQNEEIISDFNNALNYLISNGVSFEEAINRLDPVQLGGFYVHPSLSWYPLDNAAIVYPLSLKHGQMPIFRLSVYLKEEVVGEILQMALNFTIKRFPSFATTIKNGFFWNYLDSCKRRFSVEEETSIPCKPLAVGGTRSQSFRVMYYRNRISVEYFHVLTDGTGGMYFLKTLTAVYLRLLGRKVGNTHGVFNIEKTPDPQETVNEFANSEVKNGVSGFMGKPAAQMSGKITDIKPCQVLHFEMDREKLHDKAREHGVTVTTYILAVMYLAIRHAMEDINGTVSIQVPVNMRKFNGSRTVRNYSMYFSCDLDVREITTLEEMLPKIESQLQEKAGWDSMSKMMSTTIKLVQSLKFVPLVVKKPFVQIAYGFLGDKIFTSFLSNLGVVEVDEGMKDDIEKFDFLLGPSPICRTNCTLVTYQNTTVFSITKITKDPSFEEAMYDYLVKDGIPFKVYGSEIYAD